MIKTILAIGLGGFLGSVARFLTSRFIQNSFISIFPLGTFLVNISGCFLLGVIYGISEKNDLLSPIWKMFLAIGFCGGYTTFSTFSGESLGLLRDGAYFYFLLYTTFSVFLGIAATLLGMIIIKLL